MVLLSQGQELPDLIRLGLASDGLEVELLGDLRVQVDVMAPPNPVQLESAGLEEFLEVGERHVSERSLSEAFKELLRVHCRNIEGRNDAPSA